MLAGSRPYNEAVEILSPLVVGYKGDIGRFILASLLGELPKANDILCVDINNSDTDVLERIEKADVIFLCVPLEKTLDWIRKFRGALDGKILVEQCSLKGFLYQDEAIRGLKTLSMHLLFRPSGTPEDERHCLVFSDDLDDRYVESFAQQLQQIIRCPVAIMPKSNVPGWERHDRLMARQQALVHRVILTLSQSLDDETSLTFVGRRVRDLSHRILAGHQLLNRMIQSNPYLDEELKLFDENLRSFCIESI